MGTGEVMRPPAVVADKIHNQLGLSRDDVLKAVERCKRLGMLKIVTDGP
jgi:biotin operon repressor